MDKRAKDSLKDEYRQNVVVQDELAKSLGFWLLREKPDLYRALSRLRYMRTTPITEEQQQEGERALDRLFHEWNRTDSHYRGVSKRVEALRAQIKAAV